MANCAVFLISNLTYPFFMNWCGLITLLVPAGEGKDKKGKRGKKKAFFRAHSLLPVVISQICFGAVDVFCQRKDLAN